MGFLCEKHAAMSFAVLGLVPFGFDSARFDRMRIFLGHVVKAYSTHVCEIDV
tara:strand:- start:206 stop:361 length:156 start_codon:yes stop_codon:yes gene_type:complete